jgi:hypothetical protein
MGSAAFTSRDRAQDIPEVKAAFPNAALHGTGTHTFDD